MRPMLLAMIVVLPFSLGACGSMAAGGDLATTVEGRVWTAEAIGGKDVGDGTKVTLKIEGARVSGKAGCNGYGGPVEIHGDRIKFGAIFSTKMACMGSGVMEQESRYLKLLQGATRGEVRTDGALVITAEGGTLEFRPE
jgi:heat shock protein HslJ